MTKFERLKAISDRGYEAFLYDCDGTLADNMADHKLSYVKVATDLGVSIDAAIVDEFAGLPVQQVVLEINKRYHCEFDPEMFEKLKYQVFYNEYIGKVKPVEHVAEHLIAHVGRVKIAVVSGSSREVVKKTLAILGLLDKVEVLVCAGETPRGKPAPDPFLEAARLLGVSPERCLVFEDGNAGVEAAKAAGMDWVRVDQLG